MTPERKELINRGLHHEKLLEESGGDPERVAGAVAYLIECMRTQLHTESVSPAECEEHRGNCPGQKTRFGWPAYAAVVTIVVAAVGLVLKFGGNG